MFCWCEWGISRSGVIILSYDHFVIVTGEEKLACHILEELSHVERFDMVLLFMSSKEKKGEKLGFKLHFVVIVSKIVSLGQLQQFINSFLLLELQQLFSNLQVARDQKKFVTSDEFEQLQKKYMN